MISEGAGAKANSPSCSKAGSLWRDETSLYTEILTVQHRRVRGLCRPQASMPRNSVSPRYGQLTKRRTRSGTSPKRERNLTDLYPLLAKADPQCAQRRKRSPIVSACARTISIWIEAARGFPSLSARPSLMNNECAPQRSAPAHLRTVEYRKTSHPGPEIIGSSVF